MKPLGHYLQRKKLYMKPLFWDNFGTVDRVGQELQKGTVVLAEGDTIIGLLADVSEKGAAQLNAIKKRSKKPYLLLVADKQKVLELVEINPGKICQIEKIMDICWPGPVTMIFKAKNIAASMVTSIDGTLAIRVPDHAGLQALLHKCGALYSTSANLTGAPVPASLKEVDTTILDSVSCVVLNNKGSEGTLASTIIDCTGDKIKIVREGAFPVEKLGL